MAIGLLGRKIGMTRIYDDNGILIPVTVIEAGPCPVVQVKKKDRDGYNAVQLGFLKKRDSLLKKPEYYHFRKYKTDAMRLVREFRVDGVHGLASKTFSVDMFSPGQKVDVSGVSKGKGFQGVMRRHGFAGQRASHGAHKVHRAPGSIGCSAYPARVVKGRRMPGHMGVENVTIKNLNIVKVDTEKNLILVKGAVPGFSGGFLRIIPKGDA